MNVESDIPVPPIKRDVKPRSKAREMARSLKIGQSILFTEFREADTARNGMHAAGMKYKWRKVKEGWRVWRTT